MTNPNSSRTSRKPLWALAGFWVAITLVSTSPLAAAPRRASPAADKGAARLMERATPEQLPSELASPELGARHTNWHRLSPELWRCPTVRSNHTVYIAIHRMNQNSGRPVLFLIHGVLSDFTTWEYVTGDLASDYEVWLVDLPGCGDSDVPNPATIEPDGYSPTALAERVLQALQQRLANTPVDSSRSVVLGGHSLGGTICIRMLSAPELRGRYAEVVRRVDHMVLFAPADIAINAVPAKFLPLLELHGWMVDVARGLGIWDEKIRNQTRGAYQRRECATAERQVQSAHILTDAGHREAAIAMLRQFAPFDPKTKRPIWPEIDALVADYANIDLPVLIVHGAWDESLSDAMGFKLKSQIPGACLVEIPHSGHSLPTEQPAQCAQLIRQFVSTGEVRVSAGVEWTVYPATTSVSPHLAGVSQLGNLLKTDTLEPRANPRLP
jgi:pimeloyl-ACP methyl ester carboxylesterase